MASALVSFHRCLSPSLMTGTYYVRETHAAGVQRGTSHKK